MSDRRASGFDRPRREGARREGARREGAGRAGRPRVHTDAVILDGAARALVARGYQGLRYRDVADASGVPVASVQHRYPTLDALRRAALCRKVRLELDDLLTALDGHADPWAWIVAMIERSVARDAVVRAHGWALWLEYLHAAARDPDLARDADEVDALWLGSLADVIARGASSGVFEPVVPVRDAARLLQGMIDGLGSTLAVPRTDAQAGAVIDLLVSGAEALLRPVPQTSGPRATAMEAAATS